MRNKNKRTLNDQRRKKLDLTLKKLFFFLGSSAKKFVWTEEGIWLLVPFKSATRYLNYDPKERARPAESKKIKDVAGKITK